MISKNLNWSIKCLTILDLSIAAYYLKIKNVYLQKQFLNFKYNIIGFHFD